MIVDSQFLKERQLASSDWSENFNPKKGTLYIQNKVDIGESSAAFHLAFTIFKAWLEYSSPISTEKKNLEKYFFFLASKWRADMAFQSSITKIVEHPAYKEIIDLGCDVVPLLLKELKERPDHWFVALKRITGKNPVSADQRGNFDQMAQAWLKWGEDNGIHI
ncbi:MAG: hypothetical protein NPINA01_01320 [Nitrospinaceae bacterium]|nr:MAG: hypothetical protein NPINA01_01320 [Nitrospinaceae bacterium]